MSIYVDSDNCLHHEQGNGFALHCPVCQVFSHLTPVSVPHFAVLVAHQPTLVGIVYRCDSCNAPVFIKYPVKNFADDRIELGSNFIELERTRERFALTYLPEPFEQLFREALNCYSNTCFTAFALLCRRIAQLLFKDLGDSGRLKVFDQLVEIRDMAKLDSDNFGVVKQIILDREPDPTQPPTLDAQHAGILLEVMKDLLYQCYVRRGKLQKAMMVRRYFAEERKAQTASLKRMETSE
jgi:hypothetical protein